MEYCRFQAPRALVEWRRRPGYDPSARALVIVFGGRQNKSNIEANWDFGSIEYGAYRAVPYSSLRETWASELHCAYRASAARHCPGDETRSKTLRSKPTCKAPSLENTNRRRTRADATRPEDHRCSWAARSDLLGAQGAMIFAGDLSNWGS